MNFPGIFLGSENVIPAFGVSKTEVSNRQYKKFLEDGGYENPDYWDFPIKIKGENYYFKNSIKLFTDKLSSFKRKIIEKKLMKISKGNINTSYSMKFFKK